LGELIGGGAAVQGLSPDILGQLGLTGGFAQKSFLAGFAPEDQSKLTESITGTITGAYQSAFGAAFVAVDEGLGKIEARVNESSSRIAKNITANVEEWLVRKMMAESLRN
jgi:hypothetical protein